VCSSDLVSLILSYPFEHHIKPDYSKIDEQKKELAKFNLVATSTDKPVELQATDTQLPYPNIDKEPEFTTEQIIEREKEGDYCLSCVGSKHLMRSKDALLDALNIALAKNEFTDVAEKKIQNAVYELNSAEVDLDKARVPEQLKPVVDEFKIQLRKLRNFLRQDQSGLEIATVIPKERFNDMKKSLEVAGSVNDALITGGYEIAKIQMKIRAEEIAHE
jgi:hypothetical protein